MLTRETYVGALKTANQMYNDAIQLRRPVREIERWARECERIEAILDEWSTEYEG